MSKRRRWRLGITLALLTGGVVVWRILAPEGSMAVKVVFLGYTNSPIIINAVTSTVPMGMFMATNTGTVPVKVLPDIRVDLRTNRGDFALPFWPGPDILEPGNSVVFPATEFDLRQPWWTELAYCRHGLGIRIHDKLWNTGNAVAQGMANQLSAVPNKHWAQSGWITNRPDRVAAPGFRWAGFPWTIRSAPAIEPYTGEPSVLNSEEVIEVRPFYNKKSPFLSYSDFIDLSKPRGRYHITAPPDWNDIDFSDLSVTKR